MNPALKPLQEKIDQVRAWWALKPALTAAIRRGDLARAQALITAHQGKEAA